MKKFLTKRNIAIFLILLSFLFIGIAIFLAYTIQNRSVSLTETNAASRNCDQVKDDTYNSCFDNNCNGVKSGSCDQSCVNKAVAAAQQCERENAASPTSANSSCSRYAGDVEACNAASCAYYYCTKECKTPGQSVEQVCGQVKECASGASCSSDALPGTSLCKVTSSSTAIVSKYCCPTGETIVKNSSGANVCSGTITTPTSTSGGNPSVSTNPINTTAASCGSMKIDKTTLNTGETATVTMVVNNPSSNTANLDIYNKANPNCSGVPCAAKIAATNVTGSNPMALSVDGKVVRFTTTGTTQFVWKISYSQLFGTADAPKIDNTTSSALVNVQLNGLGGGMTNYETGCVVYINKGEVRTTQANATAVTTVVTQATSTLTTTSTTTLSASTSTVSATSTVTTTTAGNLPSTGINDYAFWLVGGIIFLVFPFIIQRRFLKFEDKVLED